MCRHLPRWRSNPSSNAVSDLGLIGRLREFASQTDERATVLSDLLAQLDSAVAAKGASATKPYHEGRGCADSPPRIRRQDRRGRRRSKHRSHLPHAPSQPSQLRGVSLFDSRSSPCSTDSIGEAVHTRTPSSPRTHRTGVIPTSTKHYGVLPLTPSPVLCLPHCHYSSHEGMRDLLDFCVHADRHNCRGAETTTLAQHGRQKHQTQFSLLRIPTWMAFSMHS